MVQPVSQTRNYYKGVKIQISYLKQPETYIELLYYHKFHIIRQLCFKSSNSPSMFETLHLVVMTNFMINNLLWMI